MRNGDRQMTVGGIGAAATADGFGLGFGVYRDLNVAS